MQFRTIVLGALALASGSLAATSGPARLDTMVVARTDACAQVGQTLTTMAAKLDKPIAEINSLTKQNATMAVAKPVVQKAVHVLQATANKLQALKKENVKCQLGTNGVQANVAARQGDPVTAGVDILLPKVNVLLVDLTRVVNTLPLAPVTTLVEGLEPALGALILGLEAVVAGDLLPVLSGVLTPVLAALAGLGISLSGLDTTLQSVNLGALLDGVTI